MNIELTKEQFNNLLDLVYAGNWVINSTKLDNERLAQYDELESYVFSLCDRFEIPEYAVHDEKMHETFPTQEYEESGIMDLIEEYEDDIFWDELSQRLAERDIIAALEDPRDYDSEQVDDMINRRSDLYYDEFGMNGLDNIEVNGIPELE